MSSAARPAPPSAAPPPPADDTPRPAAAPTARRPSRASIAAAFAAVYIIWGSTYLGIKFAILTLPPFVGSPGTELEFAL